ncbi:MAG: hypothetical protein U1F43_10795 [Myxococcota bacterium]
MNLPPVPPPAHQVDLGAGSGHVHKAHSHVNEMRPGRFVRKRAEKSNYTKEQAQLFGETIEKIDPRGMPYELEQPGAKGDWSTLGIIVMAICVVIAFAVTMYIALDDDANTRMSMFFKGSSCGESGTESCLQLYVTQDKRRLEEMWRQEDLRAKPIYGTVEMKYTPQRARVDIWQLKFVKSGSAAARNEAGYGEAVCVTDAAGQKNCETAIPNKTADLPEGKHVETLKISDLPLYETERDPQTGNIAKVFTYVYHVKLSFEGYESREFLWRPQDWQPALGNYAIPNANVDLVAKPETLKDNFVQAHKDLKCLLEKKKFQTIEQLAPNEVEGVYTTNGFKDVSDWKRVEEVLTDADHTAWWTEKQKEITDFKCPTE